MLVLMLRFWLSPTVFSAATAIMVDERQADSLVDDTYDQMKRLAASYLQLESATVTLSPTVLVHEAYVKLTQQFSNRYQSRGHFLAIAATIMRRILVDHARARKRIKRGGDLVRVVFDDDLKLTTSKDGDILALEEFLQELGQLDERQAKIVEMRFFGGMTVPEVAEVLGLSTRTIENEWRMCRAWLRKRIEETQ